MFAPYQLLKHSAQVLEMRAIKLQERTTILGRKPLQIQCPNLTHARWKLDLMWNGSQLGLRGRLNPDDSLEFHPLLDFDNAAPEIIELCKWFASCFPLKALLSLRFRKDLNGLLGLWIDASRADLDTLKTNHKDWVQDALHKGIVVEVGQRNEEWVYDQELHLVKSTRAKPRAWLPSFTKDQKEMALVSTIAAFSQPGPLANQCMIGAGHTLLDTHFDHQTNKEAPLSWGEWGAGNGNLSASFATRLGQSQAWISEPDPKSFQSLELNHKEFFPQATIKRTAATSADQKLALWILDPPRSGFPDLIRNLGQDNKPEHILIYHCALDGLQKDNQALIQTGYELMDWIFCDVFPGSIHAEAVSLWRSKIPC